MEIIGFSDTRVVGVRKQPRLESLQVYWLQRQECQRADCRNRGHEFI